MTAPDGVDDGLDAIGALADETRRAAYRVVAAGRGTPVGREEVAAALGVGRTLAAFHLDKLVDAGLLEVSFARRTGRSGPGAGRTAKLYRRVATEHVVSVPERAYRSAAEVLAEAVERAGADEMVFAVARERGRAAGSAAPGADLTDLLGSYGYEPFADGDRIRLRNCPFHRLADRFPPVVCGMNLALLQGMLDGGGLTGWRPEIDPTTDTCCVAFTPISKTKDS
jgi:predicted ArsR family transcriptional regulator